MMKKRAVLTFIILICVLIVQFKPSNKASLQAIGENDAADNYALLDRFQYFSDIHFQNYTRNSIFSLIETCPGIHFREICRELSLSIGVVQYHLQVLEEERKVIAFRNGKYKRFFEFRKYSEEEKTIISNLRHPLSYNIVTYLNENPRTNHMELAKLIGVPSQLISWHISKLMVDEIIIKETELRKTIYSVNPVKLFSVQNYLTL